ncbi:hypothetical protein [Nocardia brasiliensis]
MGELFSASTLFELETRTPAKANRPSPMFATCATSRRASSSHP